jgi:hypothetical protein
VNNTWGIARSAWLTRCGDMPRLGRLDTRSGYSALFGVQVGVVVRVTDSGRKSSRVGNCSDKREGGCERETVHKHVVKETLR